MYTDCALCGLDLLPTWAVDGTARRVCLGCLCRAVEMSERPKAPPERPQDVLRLLDRLARLSRGEI